MTYSEEQLNKIFEMASVFSPLSDIAILLDLPLSQLRLDVSDVYCPAYSAYHRGKATAALELRQQEMALAKVGSPLGIESVTASFERMLEDEIF